MSQTWAAWWVSIFSRNNFLCQQNSISGRVASQEANETWFGASDNTLPCLPLRYLFLLSFGLHSGSVEGDRITPRHIVGGGGVGWGGEGWGGFHVVANCLAPRVKSRCDQYHRPSVIPLPWTNAQCNSSTFMNSRDSPSCYQKKCMWSKCPNYAIKATWGTRGGLLKLGRGLICGCSDR